MCYDVLSKNEDSLNKTDGLDHHRALGIGRHHRLPWDQSSRRPSLDIHESCNPAEADTFGCTADQPAHMRIGIWPAADPEWIHHWGGHRMR